MFYNIVIYFEIKYNLFIKAEFKLSFIPLLRLLFYLKFCVVKKIFCDANCY